ncbi:MAG: hypothetical protein ACREMD_02760, partial [Gemmatimonadota bacterium]
LLLARGGRPRFGRHLSTRILGAAVAILLVTGGGCPESGGVGESMDTEPEPERSIEEVLDEHTPAWMEVPGVVGTGIGLCDGRRCIRVFVAERTLEVEREIPTEIEGYRVDVVVTGEFEAREIERP